MGLLSGEIFIDAVAITDAAGVLKTGLTPTCTAYNLTAGTSAALAPVEVGVTGTYKASWTPAADGEYLLVWIEPLGNTVNYPFKLFKVGAGQEKSLLTNLAVVDALHDVPTADVATNVNMRDVV